MSNLLKNKDEKERIEIPIFSRNPIKNRLIPIRAVRQYFPGYKVPFKFKTDIGTINVHVTSAKSGDVDIGAIREGRYIKSPRSSRAIINITEWFKKHGELEVGDKFIIEIIEPFKLYELKIEKK